jgi:hypothetical protein
VFYRLLKEKCGFYVEVLILDESESHYYRDRAQVAAIEHTCARAQDNHNRAHMRSSPRQSRLSVNAV